MHKIEDEIAWRITLYNVCHSPRPTIRPSRALCDVVLLHFFVLRRQKDEWTKIRYDEIVEFRFTGGYGGVVIGIVVI